MRTQNFSRKKINLEIKEEAEENSTMFVKNKDFPEIFRTKTEELKRRKSRNLVTQTGGATPVSEAYQRTSLLGKF